MKFAFTGRKMEVSDAMKEYTRKKLSKLDRFFQNDAEAQVTYRTERGRDTVEVTVKSANMYFRAQETANDVYAAIDSIVDLIERQIRKNKTRLEKRLRSGAFEQPVAASWVEPEETFEVVRRKRFALKPMTPEEAILQMNLLEHEFFVFKNTVDGDAFSVVYRRRQGGYGLISAADV